MSLEIKNLVRPHLLGLKPYSSARSEYSGEGILLDANENALGSVCGGNYNRYPDPLQKELKAKIIHWLNPELSIDNVFCGNGSDEIIDLLVKAFCRPGEDEIMVFPPVFGMYEKCAQINDVGIHAINLTEEFQLDIPAIKEQINDRTKIIFICSPNNPSGNLIHSEDIKIVLDSFQGLLVIDEAYIGFSNTRSWVDQFQKYPNLVILRTFSKAWGMAALRLGIGIGNTEVIEVLNTIKMPYNINSNTIYFVSKALDRPDIFKDFVDRIKAERAMLEQQISWLEITKKVYPSEGNYLLIKFVNSLELYGFLKKKGLIVRDRNGQPHCNGCLRITVGSPEENKILLEALRDYEKLFIDSKPPKE
ncbi:MAG: histidinol-phosphate transaminase [Chitinophagales bacterium]